MYFTTTLSFFLLVTLTTALPTPATVTVNANAGSQMPEYCNRLRSVGSDLQGYAKGQASSWNGAAASSFQASLAAFNEGLNKAEQACGNIQQQFASVGQTYQGTDGGASGAFGR